MLRPVSPSEPSSPLRAPDTNRTPSPPSTPVHDPSAAGPSGQATLMTPAPGASARRKFLETEMGSKDLADLADMMDQTEQRWAYTGSTAAEAWRRKLACPEAEKIIPADADIVTTETGVDMISREEVPTGVEGEAPKPRGETFMFNNRLSVDLLASAPHKLRFGDLKHDVRTYCGTPIMSLEVLRRTKIAAIRDAADFGDHAKVRRGTEQLALINRLIDMKTSSPARDPATQSATLQQRPAVGTSSPPVRPVSPRILQEQEQEPEPRGMMNRRRLDFSQAEGPRKNPRGA